MRLKNFVILNLLIGLNYIENAYNEIDRALNKKCNCPPTKHDKELECKCQKFDFEDLRIHKIKLLNATKAIKSITQNRKLSEKFYAKMLEIFEGV